MQRPSLRILKTIAIAFVLLWAGSEVAHAQWTQVNGVPAGANPSTCLLLTDGTVMCQANEGGNGWLRLTPDNTGNYENGKWTSLDNAPEGTDSTDVTEATPATCAPCLYSPTYYASAVLPDGRVVVIGGEYNVNSTGSNGALTDIGFLFDPTKPSGSQWSAQLTNPFGYGLFGPDTLGCTGDSESVITQTGTMLIANVCGFSNAQIASFDPSTLTFTAINPTGKNGNESNDEEGWTILPGGNVFTVDANSPENSEIYDPTTNAWGQDVNTAGIELTDLSVNCDSHELGPAVALANGTIIQFSGNPSGQNALYTIATNSWASSPGFNFPSPTGVPDTVADGPASWLVNGDALVIASPGCIPTGGGKYSTFNAPIHVYEFNGATLSDVTPSSPGSNGPVNNNASFVYRMLLLPSGRVLVTHRGDGGSPGDVWTYTPSGPVVSPGEPVITSVPSVIGQGQTYSISGQMFNGFTQGASYGDDAQDATNWPLVRITNTGSGHVAYVRTHDHSRMGVEAVGDPEIVSTNFDLPADFELGASTLVVVTNGLASDPVDVTVEESTSLAFTAASATSSDYSDPATVQAVLTSGGTPVSGESITFVLGSGAGTETCSGTTNGAGLATCSITPNQAAGGYTLTATFAGDATYTGSTISTPFTILHEETAIAFTGASATNSDYHDAATVQVLLTTDSGTTVIGSEMVTITLGSGAGTETCSGTTNSSGIAFCSITPNQQAGVYTITVAFAGDAFYAASMNSAPFTINLEETTTKFTASSPTVIANGQPATFSATLLEDGTIAPVPFGQTVTVTLGTGITAQTCNGTTNATGLATCTIASVNQPLGPNTVGAKFAGDPYYQPSSASEPVILFAFLPHGSMIIGNLDAATGTHVEFWGATWSTVNALSGGPAPNSFKGFADNSLQSCGGNWSTSPGNSSGPPATLPSYMGVIASGAAAQSGSTISGTGPIIVVVQTNLGYAANPGHPGTGTVVATYCHP